jgi:hypothetical protein
MREIRGPLPAPERAAGEFTAAMEAWDPERAERSAVALARNRNPGEVVEMLWRYGARDYRNIGHKAIYVANAARTLDAIGWQHAEPVLRSLVLALLDFGREQQVNGYALDDQCYSANAKRGKEMFPRLPNAWASDRPDADATRSIVAAIRESSPEEACADVAGRLVKGQAGAGAVWDAVHLAGAEVRMRVRASAAIVGLHAVTSANALRYAYMTAGDPQMRLLALLQGVGWMGQFRKFAETREENLRSFPVTSLEPSAGDAPLDRALAETFASVRTSPDESAARAFGLARDLASRQAFQTAALRYTLAKADEVHYYKYLAALVEDTPLVSPQWQPHLVAAMVYYTKGSSDPEPAAMKRAREALRGLA